MSNTQGLPGTSGKRRLLQLLPAGLFALVAAGALAAPQPAPEVGELAVIFPPFVTETEAWARVQDAGGYVVGPTNFAFIVVAYADDEGFKERMRAQGALFFTAATGLCSQASS